MSPVICCIVLTGVDCVTWSCVGTSQWVTEVLTSSRTWWNKILVLKLKQCEIFPPARSLAAQAFSLSSLVSKLNTLYSSGSESPVRGSPPLSWWHLALADILLLNTEDLILVLKPYSATCQEYQECFCLCKTGEHLLISLTFVESVDHAATLRQSWLQAS